MCTHPLLLHISEKDIKVSKIVREALPSIDKLSDALYAIRNDGYHELTFQQVVSMKN